MPRWTESDLPDQSGRIVVVTGANSGIGLDAARMLAGKGATVILACRTASKAEAALHQIRAVHPNADLHFLPLDLSSLSSVRAFATTFEGNFPRLDLLINNAGIMAIPRTLTADGFEMQIGTNHFGHFALTGLLLPALRRGTAARIVNVASNAHGFGKMHFDDLAGEKHYSRWGRYGQSKLANLLFTYELDRRLRAANLPIASVACHPGYSATNLANVAPQMDGSAVMEWIVNLGSRLIAQPSEMGALPTVYAAGHPDIGSGDYVGPDGLGEWYGWPKKVQSSARSHDAESARTLWSESVRLTGVDFGGL